MSDLPSLASAGRFWSNSKCVKTVSAVTGMLYFIQSFATLQHIASTCFLVIGYFVCLFFKSNPAIPQQDKPMHPVLPPPQCFAYLPSEQLILSSGANFPLNSCPAESKIKW